MAQGYSRYQALFKRNTTLCMTVAEIG